METKVRLTKFYGKYDTKIERWVSGTDKRQIVRFVRVEETLNLIERKEEVVSKSYAFEPPSHYSFWDILSFPHVKISHFPFSDFVLSIK
jgi:hypothetical protein